MTKTPKPPPSASPGEMRSITSSSSLGSPEAKRRRKALRDFLTARGLTATDLARKVGMPTPNAIFNLLNGYSASLSVDAVERILRACPDASFAEIVGLPPQEGPPPIQPRSEWSYPDVVVSTIAQAGVWRRSFSIRPERWMLLPLPRSFGPTQASMFGAWVHEPDAEGFYPAGSILICRRASVGQVHPRGRRFVVARHRGQRQEVTVRELVDLNGQPVLQAAAEQTEHQDSIPMPLPSQTEIELAKDERLEIVGYVVASMQWEEPLPLP